MAEIPSEQEPMNHDFLSHVNALADNIRQVVVTSPDVIRMAVLGLLCQGHVLLDDFPGVGKTLLSKALAQSLRASFKRIQFTPDLLPTDITGSSIYNPGSGEFQFVAGPVFANIVLADEINRSSPRTQSALLEAMGEDQVTFDGVTYPLPKPFLSSPPGTWPKCMALFRYRRPTLTGSCSLSGSAIRGEGRRWRSWNGTSTGNPSWARYLAPMMLSRCKTTYIRWRYLSL